MTTGSLGLRSSGSYGSLQQQIQNGSLSLPIQITPPRKPAKVLKEKDKFFLWICRFAPKRGIGMLLLCIVAAAVFSWVLYVGKGEDAQETMVQNLNTGQIAETRIISGALSYTRRIEEGANSIVQPLPSSSTFFTGYTLPLGNPCEGFTLPPPPADKKRTGPRPCPVCYLPLEDAIAHIPNAPSFSPVLKNLTYIHEENLLKSEFGGSEFGGYPSLKERNDSYDIRESMHIHCGFVRGVRPGQMTGFDIDESDLNEMETCGGVVVASAIFGAFDLIRQPRNISKYSKGSKHLLSYVCGC